MNYVVYLTNDADYQAALMLSGGGPLINKAPRALATMLGIPYPYPSGDLSTISKTITFIFPHVPGTEYLQSPGGATGIFVDDTVDYQVIPQNSGVPSLTWPPGQAIKYVWTANLVKANGGAGTAPTSVTPIPQRRWIEGFEWGNQDTGSQWTNFSRNASRVIEGRGWSLRGAATPMTKSNNTYRTGLNPPTSWERFYLRVRKLPTVTETGLWRTHGSPTANCGIGLRLKLNGDVNCYSIDNGGVHHDEGLVFTPNIDEYYLIDTFLKYAPSGGGNTGIIRIYINHTFAFQFIDNIGEGLNNGNYHNTSDLGFYPYIGYVADDDVEVDFDDWTSADLPANVSSSTLQFNDTNYSIDWLMGTHIKAHYSKPSSPLGFTGNFEALNQGLQPVIGFNTLTSNVPSALLEGITDVLALDEQPTLAAVLGPLSVIINISNTNVGATDGTLGYKIAGGAAVLTTINQTAAFGTQSVAYLPSGLTVPIEIAPFSVVHQKSADANLDTTYDIDLSVEYIGIWAEEDYSAFIFPVPRIDYLHNCKYENTGWGYLGAVPSAPVYIYGGTYVGNGTYQDIELPAPCHFLWVRATAGGDRVYKTWGASFGAERGDADHVSPALRMFADSTTGKIYFRAHGTDININANGVTFQFIAFCDPGMRFNICGEIHHNVNAAVPHVHSLIDPNFTPEAMFLYKQVNLASNVNGLSFKGPAHPGIGGHYLPGGAIANMVSFALGTFNAYADLFAQGLTQAYSAWRTVESGCTGTMVQICSYTGDGTGNRADIPITPASGRYPMFIVVMAEGQAAQFRDPSHINLESSNTSSGALSNTGITAVGIDKFSVDTSLNVNARIYHVFAFPGSELGMLNGLYYNEICDPPVGPHLAPADINGDIILVSDGGVSLGADNVSGTPTVVQEDISGIYTIVTDKLHDTFQDRLPGQPTIERAIPNPFFKTGYIGG